MNGFVILLLKYKSQSQYFITKITLFTTLWQQLEEKWFDWPEKSPSSNIRPDLTSLMLMCIISEQLQKNKPINEHQ